jgi:bifunctional UDP-N-acetylglucosamine pyrophosphorylase/glucosamine-1-phosphate N-acetyltransferase
MPKVLQPLAQKPLLVHVLETAQRLTPLEPILVYGYGGDAVQAALNSRALIWALQAEQKGTGHAVLQAMPWVEDDETCVILYGDVPLIAEATLQRLIALAANKDVVLLTDILDNPSGYGRIVRDPCGAILAIREHKDASANELGIREVNTGILAARGLDLKRWLSALRPNNAQGELYLTDIISMAVSEGKQVAALHPQNSIEVIGVNDKVQLAQLERAYQQMRAQELMQRGLTLIDPQRFDCRGELEMGSDCCIDVNCVFEGRVVLGNRVSIGPNVIIRDCEIGDDVQIHANSYLEGARIDASVQIGPFARLRPDTHMMSGSRAGNFVEIKKSTIGEGSKINHLSYIGDTEMGRDVNIGAGTITCNYDGVNKHQTKIGDQAFIGSNSQLVAPVEIGQGATIGAGSTITKDAPEHALTLSRAKQMTHSGWARPTKKPTTI